MAVRRLAAAVAVLGVVATAGCGRPGEARLEFSDTEPVKVTEIRLERGSGDVTVRTSAIGETRIRRVVRYRDERADVTHRLDGTVLHLATRCGPRCSVSYDVEAPVGVSVRGELGSGDLRLTGVSTVDVQVGSGDVTLDGATGAVDVRTGSGDVTASAVAGALTTRTGSGDVTGDRLGGAAVTVETGAGGIDLTLDEPATVRARANSGDVTVAVPDGRYRVTGDSRSGDRTVEVTEDPAAPHVLDISTGSGDVTVVRRQGSS